MFNTSDIYVLWDKRISSEDNFRYTLTNGTYKGTRDKERNVEVYSAIPSIARVCETLGIKIMQPYRLEADDVISWLCNTLEGKKIIVSVDKDFLQLVNENVTHYNPIKKFNTTNINFESSIGMSPKEFLYYKAIVGDISDNISGVEGYGPVKGMKLAKAFARNEEKVIDPFRVIVENNLKLVDLNYGYNLYPEEIKSYKEQYLNISTNTKVNFDSFKEICVDLEFESVLNNMDDWKSAFNRKDQSAILAGYFKSFE